MSRERHSCRAQHGPSKLGPVFACDRIERFVSLPKPHTLYIIMCTARFLYYFSVYVNLFKELFSFVAIRRISEKRVQRYRLFRYPPNISRIIFHFSAIVDLGQGERGGEMDIIDGIDWIDRIDRGDIIDGGDEADDIDRIDKIDIIDIIDGGVAEMQAGSRPALAKWSIVITLKRRCLYGGKATVLRQEGNHLTAQWQWRYYGEPKPKDCTGKDGLAGRGKALPN